ncbi:hypothetical protein B7982_02555 [Fibrobacter sp. UWB2]|uniref:hypothetical protein n=1 Tax=Fibrobacter sp. UWB2 TaxID=1964358 RepID=UPI000B523D12|nr:hypothetical protein [Fibrobacter sp. UWB2]OWV24609.1 hypothetical protein B7982_02555 [Fibrobacter sp. UWB2]
MNSTYAQKSSTVQKAADTKAASVLDSSAQGESLQRKADMANAAQRVVQRVALDTNIYKSCFQNSNACVGAPTVEGDEVDNNVYYSTLASDGNNKLYNTDVEAKNAAKMVAKEASRNEPLEKADIDEVDRIKWNIKLEDKDNNPVSGPETLEVTMYKYLNERGQPDYKYVGYGFAYHSMDSTNMMCRGNLAPAIVRHYHAIKRELIRNSGEFEKKSATYDQLGTTKHYLVKPY